METGSNNIRRLKIDKVAKFLPFILLVLVGLVRASVLFSTPLMPKVNGAYYLVQVRSILSEGSLAFDDFPLLFWLEAALAQILLLFRISQNSAVVVASKLFDSIVPACTMIPIYYLVQHIDSEENGNARLLPALLIALFASLSFAPVAMIADFQKNSLGMTFMALSIWALYVAMRRRDVLRWSIFMGVLILTGLIHEGAFAATLLIVGSIFVVYLLIKDGSFRSKLIHLLIVGIGSAVVIGLLWMLVVRGRVGIALELTDFPMGLIRPPSMLLSSGKATFTSIDVGIVVFSNIVALCSLVLIRRSARYTVPTRALIIGALITTFILASPFISSAWALRFYLMSYLPVAICIGFLLAIAHKGWSYVIVAALLIIITVLSGVFTLPTVRLASIPENSYKELASFSSEIEDPKRTLVIARHGLEWWAAWTLRTDVSEEYNVSPDDWKQYKSVYFLQQLVESRGGPAGPLGPPFPEVRVPDNAKIVREGRYFRLSTSEKPPEFYPMKQPEHP